MHSRVGHVRFPRAADTSKNAPTNAALPVADERVLALRDLIVSVRDAAHLSALNPGLTPDARAQNLGAYQTSKAILTKLNSLFQFEIILPGTSTEPTTPQE